MQPRHSLRSHSLRITHRSSLLGTVAGVAAWLGAESAAAAAPCAVTDISDDVNVPGSLRYCVDQVNQGLTDHVVLQAALWYSPNSPLVFERSARLTGWGRIVMPGDEFVGDSLFVVGTQCPGAGCVGQAVVEIEGVEIAAVGVTDVRGIDVRDGHELTLEGVQMYEFTKPGSSGGCVRAGQQSALTIVNSSFEGCMAADGGAVFSEATTTQVEDSSFASNVAGWNGGAIAIGTANFFLRTLSVVGSSFEGNLGGWGGAVKATGTYIEVEMFETEFLANAATRGGGMFGKGTFDTCLFEENQAKQRGGGLELVEDGTVRDTTLRSNASAVGGGLAFVPAGSFSLMFEGNTAVHNTVAGDAARGAGLAVLGGEATVRNSTFSENGANDDIDVSYGGGLAVLDAKVSVEHATFAFNKATVGGGIHADGWSQLELISSIVAYSKDKDCEIQGGFGTLTSLDTDGTCNVDISAVDPQLDPLSDNGGPTWTHWPSGSEAQDAAACWLPEDQRHMPRDKDVCEVGAVEL